MIFGKLASLTRGNREHLGESSSNLQSRPRDKTAQQSQQPTESEKADENKTTLGCSRCGVRTFSEHEQFLTFRDYVEHPKIDRHFVKDFGEFQHTNGEFYKLHYVTSSGEFVISHTDPTHVPRGFVLKAYCADVYKARDAMPAQSPAYRGSLQDMIEYLERKFPC